MSANAAPLLVVCLCADWCGSCREYRSAFEALRERYGGSAELAWIDVEDESEALGDPDIENFPTLLVAAGDVALFYGAVTPPSAERLVAGAIDGSLAPAADSDADALVARVRRLLAGGADAA